MDKSTRHSDWCGDSEWGVHSGNPCEFCGTEQSLTDFLLARIAERESGAVDIHARHCSLLTPPGFPCDCGEPARVLADCAAQRRLIEWGNAYWSPEANQYARMMQEEFATVYAGHPDYREEWRP